MEKEARESSVGLGFVSRREEIKACCQNTESISEGSLQGAIFSAFFSCFFRGPGRRLRSS